MKYVIVAMLLVNNAPTQVVFPERYETRNECNYQMMRRLFQMHTKEQWSLQCVEAK